MSRLPHIQQDCDAKFLSIGCRVVVICGAYEGQAGVVKSFSSIQGVSIQFDNVPSPLIWKWPCNVKLELDADLRMDEGL